MRKVEIQSQKLVFADFFKIEEAILRYEKFDGTMSRPVRRLNFLRGDSVAAVVFNEDTQSILLTNQFKYPTYEKGPAWISELVAGMVNKGESAEAAMHREIIEEMGYRASKLAHISTFYVSPGGTSERIILFFAPVKSTDRVQKGGGLEAEAEDIQLVEVPLHKLKELIGNGEIQDAKTLVGLMWLLGEKGL